MGCSLPISCVTHILFAIIFAFFFFYPSKTNYQFFFLCVYHCDFKQLQTNRPYFLSLFSFFLCVCACKFVFYCRFKKILCVFFLFIVRLESDKINCSENLFHKVLKIDKKFILYLYNHNFLYVKRFLFFCK